MANTDISRKMIDINRELSVVMDNPNFRRDKNVTENDKMYKIYGFQDNKGTFHQESGYFVHNQFNLDGEMYLEYCFGNAHDESYKLEAKIENMEFLNKKTNIIERL